jgi:hypothetical protein
MIRLRSGRSANAAITSLNRFTEVESLTITCPGLAPTSRAIFPPPFAPAPVSVPPRIGRCPTPPHRLLQPRRRRLRQPPQRVAVQVDQLGVRDDELLAHSCKFVQCVQFEGMFATEVHGRFSFLSIATHFQSALQL